MAGILHIVGEMRRVVMLMGEVADSEVVPADAFKAVFCVLTNEV